MKLPVIRGHVGDWRYYTGVMKFKEIEEIVTPSVDEFCNLIDVGQLIELVMTRDSHTVKFLIEIKLGKRV
jgi:hypothetical protein